MRWTPRLLTAALAVLGLGLLGACGGGGDPVPLPPKPPNPEFAPIPAKSIDLALVGIHDESSDAYNADCVSCHGERTKEKALDGKTPAAHATMLEAIPGTGNDRCLHCHEASQDFLAHSAGGLREPVNIEMKACAGCHAAGTDIPFYVR